MIKGIATFIFLAAVFGFTIQTVRQMTGKEKWQLTKLLGYATLCSLLSIVAISFIVILF
jgi:hypothetical protein